MRTLAIDIETYSPLDIADCGVYTYASHIDFEILLLAYAFDEEPVKVIDLAQGEELPTPVSDALNSPLVLKTAFNANFERTCLRVAGIADVPANEWSCTMATAGKAGLPMSLAQAGEALQIEQGKMAEGKALIRYFCQPCKPTRVNGMRTRNLPKHDPAKWEVFKQYCRRDVEVEREIRNRCKEYAIITPKEFSLYSLDQKIADLGVKVDMPFVTNAAKICAEHEESLKEEMTRLTGIDNPKSGSQLIGFLTEETGEDVTSVAKSAVKELRGAGHSDTVNRVLDLRSEMAKTSNKKYDAIINCVAPDGRVHGLLQYYGANRTGRWASRLVQLQNLPQNHLSDLNIAREIVTSGNLELLKLCYENVPDTLSQLIRTSFIPKDGCTFYVSDFSAIEARVIAWLAGESWRMKVFEGDGKIYEASYAKAFHVPVESVTKGSPERQKGKIMELALGYGGGVGALKQFGADKLGLSDTEMQTLVNAWREASPAIPYLWKKLTNAATTCIQTGKKVTVSRKVHDPQRALINEQKLGRSGFSHYFDTGGNVCTFKLRDRDNVLQIILPSGRALCYADVLPDGENFTYMGVNQTTRKWERQRTYGGKLTENIVQAIARDCLAEAMLKLDESGFSTVMHIHDEVIIEASSSNPKDKLNTICRIMGCPVEWAPGLKLRAEGYATEFYKKD